MGFKIFLICIHVMSMFYWKLPLNFDTIIVMERIHYHFYKIIKCIFMYFFRELRQNQIAMQTFQFQISILYTHNGNNFPLPDVLKAFLLLYVNKPKLTWRFCNCIFRIFSFLLKAFSRKSLP